MALEPGDIVLLRYNVAGRPLYHERLILCLVPGDPGNYGVLTPDMDVFLEEIRGNNDDLHSFHASDGISHRPHIIANSPIHGFDLPYPTAEEMRGYVRDACLQAASPLPPLPLNVEVHGAGPLFVPAAIVAAGVAAAALGVVAVGAAVPLAGGAVVALGGPPLGGVLGGIPVAGVLNAIPLPWLNGLVPIPGCWVLDEPHINYDIGQPFTLPPHIIPPIGSTRIICQVDAEESVLKFLSGGVDLSGYVSARSSFLGSDRRVLECPLVADGKTVTLLLNEMSVQPGGLPHGLDSAPTAPWFFQEVAQSGKSFSLRDSTWKAESGVNPHLPLAYEHEVESIFFDIAIMTDRLIVKYLASCEWLARRMQLQDYAVLENPSAPSFEGARFFMGKGSHLGGALMSPALQALVAQEVSQEAALYTEKMKSLEARKDQDGGKNTKTPKGGDKGGGNPEAPAKV